jgi:HEAT repeat protein
LKDDKDMFVRRFAAKAIGGIGTDAKSAVPALTNAMHDGLKDGKTELSEAAVEALGHMGPTAVAPLVEALKTKSTDKPEGGKKKEVVETKEGAIRKLAAQAIGSLGKDAKTAVPTLTDLLKDKEARTEAAQALGNIGPDAKSALDALKEIEDNKKEKDKAFKKAVGSAIKKIEAK